MATFKEICFTPVEFANIAKISRTSTHNIALRGHPLARSRGREVSCGLPPAVSKVEGSTDPWAYGLWGRNARFLMPPFWQGGFP